MLFYINKKYIYWYKTRKRYCFSLKDMLVYIRKMHQDGKWGNKTFYPKLEFAIMKCAEGDTLSQIVNKTFK